MDAIAGPFVQGRLRKQRISATIETVCGQSGRPLTLRVDADLNVSVREAGAEPLLFHPQVDWATFDEPNIIHGF